MPEKPIEIPKPDKEAEAKKKAEAEAAAKKKKDEELKKQAAKQPPPLYYFDVKVETMLPATLTYRVLAEDAVQAADKIAHVQPNSVKHRLIGRRDQKLTVYDAGTTMIKWMKRLMG
jgi:hypothetical protein